MNFPITTKRLFVKPGAFLISLDLRSWTARSESGTSAAGNSPLSSNVSWCKRRVMLSALKQLLFNQRLGTGKVSLRMWKLVERLFVLLAIGECLFFSPISLNQKM